MCVARQAIHTSSANISMPPSRWPITTMGLSSRVTVHMPSKAWKITTARVSSAARAVDVAPAQRGDQQDRLADQSQGTGGAMPAHHVQRYAGGHQHAGGHHRRASESPLARGQQRQVRISMPSAPARNRCTCSRQPCGSPAGGSPPPGGRWSLPRAAARWLAIAGRPVRTAQAGIGQAYERAEHDRARRHDHGEPRRAVEIAVQRRTRGKAHQTGLTSVSATWPCPCAGRPDHYRGMAHDHEAVRIDHVDRQSSRIIDAGQRRAQGWRRSQHAARAARRSTPVAFPATGSRHYRRYGRTAATPCPVPATK